LDFFEDAEMVEEQLLVRIVPVIDYGVRALCVRPYSLHPRGCPNVGKCDRCPPQAPLFNNAFDLEQPVYAVVNEFDLAGHIVRMKERNPNWSDRQLRCVLYWQPKARKQLDGRIRRALASDRCRGYAATWCPEGMGVDVTATLELAGITLEWPPDRLARQVAFLGKPRWDT
jgi:hypothetical protein